MIERSEAARPLAEREKLGLSEVEQEVGESDVAPRGALPRRGRFAQLVHDDAPERSTLEVVQWTRADAVDQWQQLRPPTLYDTAQERDLVPDEPCHGLHKATLAWREGAVGQ